MIDKIPVNVPSEIKYLSEWTDYKIPRGRCIVDKKVCGCGYTQLCLTNPDHLILCSPRKSLLENKIDQNSQCYYFTPISISSKERKKLGLEADKDLSEYIFNLQLERLKAYCIDSLENRRPIKLLVTYDSLPKLLDILSFILTDELLDSFVVVVDEFQLVFSDARFKAGVELDFIEYLESRCKNVIFLSGTPMLENYLEAVPLLKTIPYYEFIWNDKSISSIYITKIRTSNLVKSAIEIVNLYKSGKGPVKLVDGRLVRSKEAVLFVNNVSMITEIIKGSNLTPSEVNIITAQTGSNLVKLKRCGKGFNFGRIPVRGERNKLITLCSSTAFCGVDMYSETAKSYVFSDCNIKTMAIDISIELPQIVGRQRLESNVFRRDITFYYTTSIGDFSLEEFKLEISKKSEMTEMMISNFNEKLQISKINMSLETKLLRNWILTKNYEEDYTSLSREKGAPVFNELILLSDMRSWELQNSIYRNDPTVIKILDKVGEIQKTSSLSMALETYASYPRFEERLKFLSTYINDHPEDLYDIPDLYIPYIKRFSYGELSSCGFRKDVLDKKMGLRESFEKVGLDLRLRKEVLSEFIVGNSYKKKEIKETLMKISQSFGHSVKLRAVDLDKFFNIKGVLIPNKDTGKRDAGFKIISIKEEED